MPSSEHVALEKRVAAVEAWQEALSTVRLGKLEQLVEALEERIAALEASGPTPATGKKPPAHKSSGKE